MTKNNNVSPAEEKQKSRKNIKVYQDVYLPFTALSQLTGLTHNELILSLVNKKIDELNDDQYAIYEHLLNTMEKKVK